MNENLRAVRKWLLTMLLAMGIGALFILLISEKPIDA